MSELSRITVAYGDGIGPEIMEATLEILKHAGARIAIDTIEIGEKQYLKGMSSGIGDDAWDVVRRNKVFLKAPITTPQGKGYKSLNVTFRKALGLFANVRPSVSYYPFVDSKHQKMDLVVIRENEEDLYAGVEYKFNSGYAVSYKIITEKGSERIIRYAFEYAKTNGRKKVTAFVKDNIMKISDGMFHEVFKRIAEQYPEIESNVMIVDIGSARIASRPADFDVIVTLNLYGDIISDIASEVSGSVGLAGSSNIGQDFAMFEAVHGSAPDIAGKGIANPSGLLNGAILMLEYIGQADVAAKVKNAWLKTIEDGVHTADIFKEGVSSRRVGTQEFAQAVIANLGHNPSKLAAASAGASTPIKLAEPEIQFKNSDLIGADFYINTHVHDVHDIATMIDGIDERFKLHLISSRGIKIWPTTERFKVSGHVLRCRFIGFKDTGVRQADVAELMAKIDSKGLQIANIVMLNTYDHQVGFSMAQGE